MNDRFRRLAAQTLALALVLLSPGLEPYAAAAGNVAGRAAGVTGPAAIAAPTATTNIPGMSFGTLNPLSIPSSKIAGTDGASVLPAAGAVRVAPANQASFASPVASTILPVAGAATATQAPAASAQTQLSAGAQSAVQAGAAATASESASLSFSKTFDNTGLKASLSETSNPVPGRESMGSFLGRHTARPAYGDQEPSAPEPGSPAPKRSFATTARVALLAASIPLAITFVTTWVASALGYQFHAGYQNPFPEVLTASLAIKAALGAAVLAPISEEMIFRGGIMGWLKSVTPKAFGQAAQFWLPAIVSSAIFVSVHELSDPVLFATRFVHSMIISWAFHREGYAGSMLAHGFFNGFLVTPLVLGVFFPAWAGALAMLSLVLGGAYASWRAFKAVRAEGSDRKAGRTAPLEISPAVGLLFAAMLILGFLFVMPNSVWAVGAIGWLIYAIKRWARR